MGRPSSSRFVYKKTEEHKWNIYWKRGDLNKNEEMNSYANTREEARCFCSLLNKAVKRYFNFKGATK